MISGPLLLSLRSSGGRKSRSCAALAVDFMPVDYSSEGAYYQDEQARERHSRNRRTSLAFGMLRAERLMLLLGKTQVLVVKIALNSRDR